MDARKRWTEIYRRFDPKRAVAVEDGPLRDLTPLSVDGEAMTAAADLDRSWTAVLRAVQTEVLRPR